jgi:CHAT domain-containing protein/tetratricopeptide (TPR) repeat protein
MILRRVPGSGESMAMKQRLWVQCLALTLVVMSSRILAGAVPSLSNEVVDKPDESCSHGPPVSHAAQPASLALAEALNKLGAEALNCGDPRTARSYHLRALRIGQRLSPEGLLVAETLNRLGKVAQNKDDLVRAEQYYLSALRIRQRLVPESLIQAATLDNLGNTELQRGELTQDEGYLRHALAIRQKLAPGSRDLAMTLVKTGSLWGQRGSAVEEEDCFQRALRIGEKLAPLDDAAILDALGSAISEGAHPAKAKDYFEDALQIRQRLAPGRIEVSSTLSELGNIAAAHGDLSAAEEFFLKALDIRRRLLPGSLSCASSLSALASLASVSGNLAQAEEYHRQALEIKQGLIPGSLGVARSLDSLAVLFWQRDNLAKAEEYHRRALEIKLRLSPNSLELAQSLIWGGLIAERRGNLTQSEACFREALRSYREALRISRESPSVNMVTVRALTNVGGIETRQGDLSQAERDLGEASTIQRELLPGSQQEAFILQKMANVAVKRQQFPTAEDLFRQALSIRETKAPGDVGHVNLLFTLGSFLRLHQRLDEAGEFYERAIAILDKQGLQLGGTEEDRSLFSARYESRYKEYIDLLMEQGKPGLAFDILERSRARSLLEQLAAARIDVREGCDPALLRQERSLRESIDFQSNYRLRLLDSTSTKAQLAISDQQIARLRERYEEVEGQIRLKSPAYAALTQPQPLSNEDVRQTFLDKDTILLEYSLGKDHSYLWALSESSLDAYELPSRDAIEKTARSLYELLTAPSRDVAGEVMGEGRVRLAQRKSERTRVAAKLSGMVLGPVGHLLENKRLIVVADGALQYIPFAALPAPAPTAVEAISAYRSVSPTFKHGTTLPLVSDHEIVNLPSASVLAALREAAVSRKEPPLAVAVLADPVYDIRDERVAEFDAREGHPRQTAITQQVAARQFSSHSGSLVRSAVDVLAQRKEGVKFRRLLWTRREAEAILKAAPPGQGMQALGFQASRATATSPRLAQYRIVHFATHAVMNTEHPELSGLVLSMVDEHGRPQDGFLDLEQIYQLKLPVDLVVLSACQTGLGRQIAGEGLVGLARGFMYSGASRVIASLWSVDDEVTSELMARFYQYLERDKKSPASALRAAQLDISRDPRWSSPYYWAGFQIQGEWK